MSASYARSKRNAAEQASTCHARSEKGPAGAGPAPREAAVKLYRQASGAGHMHVRDPKPLDFDKRMEAP
eukprot:10787638-Heterocapsa_arctica.AAC.1